MNFKIKKLIIFISIVSVLTFDFQVKFLYDGSVYLNDLLLPIVFISYLKSKSFKKWHILAFIIIPLYLILNLLFNIIGSIDSFLRDSQYLVRTSYPLLLLAIVLDSDKRLGGNHLKAYAIRIFRKGVFILSIIGIIAFLLLIVGIDIFPYTSGRVWLNSRQLSSIFSEPALYGQMVTAYFFISYNNLGDLKKDIYRVLIIGVCLLFCQSAGAIFSIFVFITYLAFKEGNGIKVLKKIVLVISIIATTVYLTLSYLPKARILSLLQPQSVELDRSGEIRVANEFESMQEFFKTDVITVLFGLKNTDSNEFRVDRVDPLMGDIVGNGLVEITLRYGLVYILLISLLFYKLIPKGSYFKFLIFFMLIVQIDGAIGKPWIWFYIVMFIISTKNENIFNNQS